MVFLLNRYWVPGEKKKEFARKKKIPRCDSQLKKEKTLQKMHRVIRYGYA